MTVNLYGLKKLLVHVSVYLFTYLFIYLGFYVAFNTVQVISRQVVLWGVNQYIQLVKVLHCKLPTISKQLPTFPNKIRDLNCRPEKWDVLNVSCSSLILSTYKVWLSQTSCKQILIDPLRVLCLIQQPVSYWGKPLVLSLVEVKPTHK